MVLGLPFDVLSVILDVLIDMAHREREDTGTHHNQTLMSYAVVFRAHLPRVQQYLFSDIKLVHGHSAKLAALLVGSPHLASYVKRLTIQAIFNDCGHLATVLNSVTNLQHLGLESHENPHPSHETPKILTTALFSRFRTVSSIHCVGIVPPMWFIRSCTQLKELKLIARADSIHIEHEMPEIDASFIDSELRPSCGLEHLEVDNCSDTIIEALTTASCHPPLKTLVVKDISFSSIVSLMRNSQLSLEIFTFSGKDRSASLDGQLSLDMTPTDCLIADISTENGFGADCSLWELPLLQSMKFTLYGVDDELNELPLGNLVHILESGNSTAPRALRTLSLVLSLHTTETAPAFNTWGRIDAALAHPRYASFTKLSVRLIAMYSDEDESELQASFIQALPLLSSIDKFELEI
ncbi:hypothetical protein DXG01_008948 [Tephrocybe rancida]|nr:hypothetical protein DXG01_008948 [Tephrocybe rancida]